MAYTIQNTAGAVLTTIADGTIDTTTDLTLIGKNYAGYGDFLNENFVKLLENFSNGSAPSSPVAGQMWWDTGNNLLKVYTGTAFKTVSSSTSSASAPGNPVTGDLWWDTVNGQLKVYNGSSWTTIGPAFTASAGTSGAIVETVSDGAVNHVVVFLYSGGTKVGSVSKDSEFTPSPSITGFGSIKPGIQLATNVADAKFQGTATNADSLGGVASANYLRSDSSDSTTGVLSVLNDTGIIVGADSDFTVGVSGSDVSISNATSNGDILVKVNDGGLVTTAITVDGATSRVLVAGDPTTALGVATKQYVDASTSSIGDLLYRDGTNTITGDLMPSANLTHDLGANGSAFAEVWAGTFKGNVEGNVVGNVTGDVTGNADTATTATLANTATAITLVATNTTDAAHYPLFSDAATGNENPRTDSGFTYNPNSGILTATGFAGNLTGNVVGNVTGNVSGSAATATSATSATNATISATVTLAATNTTNATHYITFVDTATGNENIRTDTGLTYNPSTGSLTAVEFAGTATSAEYADVAERFQADAVYEAGTIVALGGAEEITRVNEELSDEVFGVISEKPAYLMNAGLRTANAAPVAVAGRVPVKVVGMVNKGDRLVSAGNGVARAAKAGEATSFNVIGRAIESKTTEGEGTVEAFVTIN